MNTEMCIRDRAVSAQENTESDVDVPNFLRQREDSDYIDIVSIFSKKKD